MLKGVMRILQRDATRKVVIRLVELLEQKNYGKIVSVLVRIEQERIGRKFIFNFLYLLSQHLCLEALLERTLEYMRHKIIM